MTELPALQPSDPLLAAALRVFERYGVRKTTLEDIAKEAGVSRSTVYRAVGTKADIQDALTREHLTRFFTDLDRLVPKGTPLTEALVSIQRLALLNMEANPVTPRLVDYEPESLLHVIIEPEDGPSQYLLFADTIGAFIEDRCPDIDRLRVTPAQAAEVLYRVNATLLLAQETYLGGPEGLVDIMLDGIFD